jgi:L-lysine 6-transaminase
MLLNNTPFSESSDAVASHSELSTVSPADVFGVIGEHMLVDALDLVVDLKESAGSWIQDSVSGKRYLDFFSFVASMPIGMNHPKMKDPAFLDKLTTAAINKPTNSDVYTAEMAEFVQTFARIAMPEYLPHVFFVEGGSLAVENALKAAFDWKVRKNFAKGYRQERGMQVIHFKQAFHGRSGYTMSLTNTDPTKTSYYPKFQWPRVTNPAMIFPLTEANIRAVENLEKIAITEIKEAVFKNKDDIAAIILEPIQGEGGDNHFRKEFFEQLRAIADEDEIMLIFDEVQTGVGLTGKMWAHQHFVQPDIIAFGKKTQVCGFMASKRIDEVPDNVFKVASRINSTWGGNLTDMVRSQRYLEIIQEEKLVEHAAIAGEHLLARLNRLQAEFPETIVNVRGRGLFCAFDLQEASKRQLLREKAFAGGLIILGSGARSIRFRPPLNISLDEIDTAGDILRDALKEV